MKQRATVTDINGTTAICTVVRESACGENCVSCSAACSNKTTIEAQNCIGAKIGDVVELEMDSSRVLFTAFLVYLFPLILLIVFYLLTSLFTERETIKIIVGFAAMAVAYGFVILFGKKNKNKYALKVEKILK